MGLYTGELLRFLRYLIAELEYFFAQAVVVVDDGDHFVRDRHLVLVAFEDKRAVLFLILLHESFAPLPHHEAYGGHANDVPLDHDKNAAEVLHAESDLAILVLLQADLSEVVKICTYFFVYEVNVSLKVNTLFGRISLRQGRDSDRLWRLSHLRAY